MKIYLFSNKCKVAASIILKYGLSIAAALRAFPLSCALLHKSILHLHGLCSTLLVDSYKESMAFNFKAACFGLFIIGSYNSQTEPIMS